MKTRSYHRRGVWGGWHIPPNSCLSGHGTKRSSPSVRAGRLLVTWAVVLPLAAVAPQSTTVIQKHRAFTIESITIARGQTLVFSNEDGFTHEIYVETPQFTFESDEQEPGTQVPVTFPVSGHFVVHCHIHPKMHLDVDVQ